MSIQNLSDWIEIQDSGLGAGAACGMEDKPEESPASCGTARPTKENPSACGMGGAPEESPASCGAARPTKEDPSACGMGDASGDGPSSCGSCSAG